MGVSLNRDTTHLALEQDDILLFFKKGVALLASTRKQPSEQHPHRLLFVVSDFAHPAWVASV